VIYQTLRASQPAVENDPKGACPEAPGGPPEVVLIMQGVYVKTRLNPATCTYIYTWTFQRVPNGS